MTRSVLDTNNRADHTKAQAFLDPNGGVTIQRYETMKYRQFDKLTDRQLGFFWRPEEIAIGRDAADFKLLNEHEKHIFSQTVRRQVCMDSCQGRSPSIAFLPIVSLPEIESWITAWTFSEMIHSRSYTYVIRNVYANSSVIFDGLLDIQEIVDCAKDISVHYDTLINLSTAYQLLGEGRHTIRTQPTKPMVVDGAVQRVPDGEPVEQTIDVSLYEIKKALWLAMMSVNVLEGIRFYVSFACSFAFGETKRMEGNAKIIKLICRDENLHLASTQLLLKTLPRDDADYVKIEEETREQSLKLFRDAVTQEKEWAHHLFQDGSMIGLNEKLLCDYVEWIANKRLTNLGLPTLYKTSSNPLPWTEKWISGAEVQYAPQEVEISSYTIAETLQDVGKDTFSGFAL